MTYHPDTYQPLSFSAARARFLSGEQRPSEFLEACLATIAEREPEVKAWVVLNAEAARAAARESDRRYQAGEPLSQIDGMPVGIKDLIETKDMPTQMGSPAYEGSFPKRDSALVRALRDAGAIILGKTVTTALGFLDPGPTTNAFDPQRTPGGSSSGSGAAVGAKMVPVAIGSQLVGSVLRPASFNANWALKPTFGGINRGERLGYSQSHVGIHAGCAEDMWATTMEIVTRVGGDPGHPGVYGELTAPPPQRPKRLAVLETEGWPRLDSASREAFESLLERLQTAGVQIIRRADLSLLDLLEQSIATATANMLRLISWEQRWSLENLVEQHPGTLGPSLIRQLESGRNVTLETFREDLALRDLARQRMEALAPYCDALISPASCGPAPRFDVTKQTAFPTGDVSFSCVSSYLGTPSVAAPLLAVEGMPFGVQIMGQAHEDERVTAYARWMAEATRHADQV
ncbi:amidase [Bordetella sp. 15P40C-2]|uniref:amidase n=1 Tax=Bordetella sp. 15P40C-2 TaxID=2572246 RepID=UPI00132B5CC7|nr:amidase [Bordetella sp. 15P40C-2]MVW72820.1 amidase [Bordetella sp. 15P40C-2]